MITLTQLSMAYGSKLLFYDANILFSDRKRYALVGANGCGKSTLLKLITGEEEPTEGATTIPNAASVGWLKQDQFRYENTILTDIVLQGKPKLWQAMVEKEQLLSAETWGDESVHRLGDLEEIIAQQDGYSALAFAEKLLLGLGIHTEYHSKTLIALSGGYKLRVLLAQTLFQQPNILLLDEPTNHLDIISIRWLENYLKNEFDGLLLYISHDIDFINNLADYIIDIDYGEVRQYSGNYDKFLSEKKVIEEQKLHLLKNIENKIAEMQKFVDRFKASAAKARQAQSRVKQIEKLDLPDIKQSSRCAPGFHFKQSHSPGRHILRATNLSKAFKEKQIFNHLDFEILRGEKVAIIGENGIGKSTLIKTLLGKIQPDTGECEWGHNISTGYFSQDHHEELNRNASLLEWFNEEASKYSEQHIRKVLGQVLFTKDDVHKNIQSISGGEAARLLLAKMMIESKNVLVLDEPTNHLDIEATESLADALANYDGTLIFVSHNRHFISKIATRILYVSRDKGLLDFKNGYQEFEEMNK